MSAPHLGDVCALLERPQLVRVLVRGVQGHAVRAHGLLVFLAVEEQLLHVQLAHVVAGARLRRHRTRVFAEGLACGAERAVGDFLSFPHLLPAQGALPGEALVGLQTLPAEAVGAGQQHRVAVDSVTQGAGEVLLQGRSILRHVLVHGFSHSSAGPRLTLLSVLPKNLSEIWI